MREIQITWQGVPATVKIEDDLPFGIIEGINKKYIDTSKAMQRDIRVNIVDYRYALVLAAVKEAPWPVNDLVAFKDIPYKLGQEIISAVCEVYPLQTALMSWVETFLGEKVVAEDVKKMIKSQ